MSKDGIRNAYNFLFLCGFVLSAPYYFLRMRRRGGWRQDFGQRFGRYSSRLKQALTNRHVIWFHAVSVGEVNLCTKLIEAVEPRLPNIKIVVSTTTSTGMEQLRRRLPSHIEKIYYPIDRRRYVRRALAVVHPDAVVLTESEIWPNFLWQLGDSGIPVFLVNARLSQRSARAYRRFQWLFRPLLAGFAGVGAQNQDDAKRWIELGCRSEAVRVVGSLKFAAAHLEERRPVDVAAMLRQLGLAPGTPILLGGSTHPGEEALLAEIFRRLKGEFPNLFLVLVPRHFERGKEVGQTLERLGIPFAYRNEITPGTRKLAASVECLLVNTTGELKLFYEHATVIFVGKSLLAQGGQNPIEPAALGKPIIFGPHMQNFAAIAASFVQHRAAIQIRSPEELEDACRNLLRNPSLRQDIGTRARSLVSSNQGALESTIDMILSRLQRQDMFVAPNTSAPTPASSVTQAPLTDAPDSDSKPRA